MSAVFLSYVLIAILWAIVLLRDKIIFVVGFIVGKRILHQKSRKTDIGFTVIFGSVAALLAAVLLVPTLPYHFTMLVFLIALLCGAITAGIGGTEEWRQNRS
ncbi:hypothetical protein EOI86_18700 [Hwanghaeella grinnelliae]|uniref:Uncharacterized protein n=1 Tax=Hwanghaeella grinnelliae TaxID=2500179 RepID=A0A437QK32_9PROT|nr:hypothetical protein [Hwanghaeella grinnelliae]RVU34870.1 hypothetical protein EOI86_18700 [Hwanghaeella grinnelliae]